MNVAALVEKWLDARSVFVLNCLGPGTTVPIHALRRFYVQNKGTAPMMSKDGNCVVAALVNAVVLFCHKSIVTKIIAPWKEMNLEVKGLSDLTNLFHGLKDLIPSESTSRLQLQRVKIGGHEKV